MRAFRSHEWDTPLAAIILDGKYAVSTARTNPKKFKWSADGLRAQLYYVDTAERLAKFFPGCVVEL